MKRSFTDTVYTMAGVALLLSFFLVWQALWIRNLIAASVFPAFTDVLGSLYVHLVKGGLFGALFATLIRIAEGYFMAAAIGITLGVSMGLSRTAERLGDPLVQFLRPMPSVVLIPLAILYFGLTRLMIVSLVTYACTWPILINTMDGVKTVDRTILDTARSFQITGFSKIRKIILPASSPLIFSGLRVSLAAAWIVAISVEIVSGAESLGLGGSINLALNAGDLSSMYAYIIVTAVAAYMLNRFLVFIQHRLVPWYASSKGLVGE